MLYLFLSVAAGGVVFQVLVSLLLVPREPCELRLLVYSVVFPTDPPLGSKGGLEFLRPGVDLCRIGISMRSGCPDRAGRASCVRDGRRSWSCTHLSGGNSNKMGGRQLSEVPVIRS